MGRYIQYIRSLTLVVVIIFLIASASWADEYDLRQAGQPWRIIANALNPLGVTLDYLVARPLHWFLHHKPVDKLTGHSQFTEKKEYIETMY